MWMSICSHPKMQIPPFHIAIPVQDLNSTREFYGKLLGCAEGRSADRWIDWNFFGHQLSTHLVDGVEVIGSNPVDGDNVPARHFGCILSPERWQQLVSRLIDAGVKFRIAPKTRFAGSAGEQSTFFLDDPSGNALEFKSFKDMSHIFRCK